MKVVIFTFGTRGDVQPYVALGSALRGRGHDVVVSTGQGFDSLIGGAGLRARTLSIDFKRLLNTPDVQQALTSFRGKIAAYKAMKQETGRQYDEMWQVVRDEQPDLLVMSPKAFPAVLMARAMSIPCVATTLQPGFVPRSDFPQFLLGQSLGAWGNRMSYRAFNCLVLLGQNQALKTWARQNLPGGVDHKLDGFAGYHPDDRTLPILQAFSAVLVPPPSEWSDQTAPTTGYWFMEPSPGTLDSALEGFLSAGEPPIYVGFGSMPAHDTERVSRVVKDAIQRLGMRAVLATGWGGLALQTSKNVHVLSSVPHDLLFPRCAALVHHGGSGTTHEGLRWGRPTVICPAGVDQPFWARRLRAVGLSGEATPLKKLTADRLVRNIQAVMERSNVERCQVVGAKMRNEQGAARAAQILESVL